MGVASIERCGKIFESLALGLHTPHQFDDAAAPMRNDSMT